MSKSKWFSELIDNTLQKIMIDKNISMDDEKFEKLVSKTVNNLIPEAAKILLKSLKSGSGEMLDEHRLIRQEFEARLCRRWSKPINLLEMLTVMSLESAEMFVETYNEKAVESNDLVYEVMKRVHARACQISNEILCLLRGGFADGAFARWRTLHELAVISFFIRKHGNRIAEQYLEFELIENYKEMLEYQKNCTRLNYEPFTEKEVQEITEQKERLVQKYGDDFYKEYGWTLGALSKEKRNYKGIEENIDLSHFRSYYKMACNNIHSGPKGNNYRLGLIDNYTEDKVLLCGPSNYGLADPGQNTAISLNQITTCLITIDPDYDMLMYLKSMEMVYNEACEEFVKAQKEIEIEEDEENKLYEE